MKPEEIAALIPRPVKERDGEPLPYWDWTYPRSEAYEAAVTPLLPAGWVLWSVLAQEQVDRGAKDANTLEQASRDYGATRRDGKASVYGVRTMKGEPKHLRAFVAHPGQPGDDEETFPPHALAEACRWCDERIAEQEAASGRPWSSNPALIDPNSPSQRRRD